MRNRRLLRITLGMALVAGCGGSDEADDHEGDDGDMARSIAILAPAEGAELEGAVLIQLGATGLEIVPAGTQQEHSGHHHLFIDRGITPVADPMPTEPGIVHLGAAQTEYLLEGLAPGPHTVIDVLGDFQHVRVAGVAPDTVRFTVR